MAQVCELTGKRPGYGNKVSHSNIKTRTRWMPNLRKKSYAIPELQQTISMLLSTRAIRTIDKLGGITPALMSVSVNGLSTRLQQAREKIYKARVKRAASGKTEAGQAKLVAKRAAKKAGTPATAAPKAAKPAKAAKAKKAKK